MIASGAGSVVSVALGLIFGSFANVCIHRLPEGESVVAPRSRCPGCGTLIAWYDNIPILSWILLRARCRGCGAAISWSYPLVEGVMGAGFLACWLVFGAGIEGIAAAWLFFTCVTLWVIDSRHFILPDVLTLTGLAAGLLFAAARGLARLPGAGEATASDLFPGGALDHPPLLLASLVGAAAGASVPLLARAGYMISRRLRGASSEPVGMGADREGAPFAGEGSGHGADGLAAGPARMGGGGETGDGSGAEPVGVSEESPGDPEHDDVAEAALEEGMGLGDVKMLAMVGAFLGPRPVFVTILAGSITGCLVVIPWLLATRRGFRTPVPFGPFLAFGALVALFVGEPLAEGYGNLILRLMG